MSNAFFRNAAAAAGGLGVALSSASAFARDYIEITAPPGAPIGSDFAAAASIYTTNNIKACLADFDRGKPNAPFQRPSEQAPPWHQGKAGGVNCERDEYPDGSSAVFLYPDARTIFSFSAGTFVDGSVRLSVRNQTVEASYIGGRAILGPNGGKPTTEISPYEGLSLAPGSERIPSYKINALSPGQSADLESAMRNAQIAVGTPPAPH